MEEMRCGLCWGSGPALWVGGFGGAAGWFAGQGVLNRFLWLEGSPDLRASLQGAESDPGPPKAPGAGVSNNGGSPGWVCGQLLSPQPGLRCAWAGKTCLKGPPLCLVLPRVAS